MTRRSRRYFWLKRMKELLVLVDEQQLLILKIRQSIQNGLSVKELEASLEEKEKEIKNLITN